MKKVFSLILVTLVLFGACTAASAGTLWYCPTCGRANDSNYCPYDGTARPTGYDGGSYTDNYTKYSSVSGKLNRRLATRTGPGTQYDEPGSFLGAGSYVTVLSKAYDSANGIWWVQVEFSEAGSRYRAYTGVKRFDGLNLSSIPEEYVIGSCRTSSSITGYYGPSTSYRAISRKVPAGVRCTIWGYAYGDSSDYIQIEFYDSSLGMTRRAWVPDWAVDDYQMYYGF